MPYDQKHRFQIGSYWIDTIEGRPGWYVFWYDKPTRHVRRAALRTPLGADEAKARLALAEFVTLQSKIKDAKPEEVPLVDILFRYKQTKTDDVTTTAMAHFEWFGTRRVSELDSDSQEEFIRHLGNKGLSKGTIRRYLAVLSAALRLARRKSQIVTVPQILLSETTIADLIGAPGDLKPRRLTVEEIAAFLDAIQTPHLWRYTMLALNTLSRPDAITDITWNQVDESGLIDLNPPGRRQTRKYRPIVPMTETLEDWLNAWKDEKSHIVHYKSQAIANPKKAFRDTAIAAGLMDATEPNRIDRAVTPYTLRRTMARLLRGGGVSLADIAAMLGHEVPGFSTTELYADADPNFLQPVKLEIERILDRISTHTKKAPVRVKDMNCTHNSPTNSKKANIYTGRKDESPRFP